MLVRCLTLAASLLALSACSAAPQVGDALTLQGTLVIRGSEPRTTPVLVRSESEHWELQQVASDAARDLQNRKVQVTGVVARTAGSGLLPALRVQTLRPQD